ncbi:MAG TPA: 3-isopropylmalate dehydratase large subunit [Anaerolineaceae bacterium]|nr:3-isopropylmalate dehydratase large subunit [Anaerolineaceae bacterium]
MTGPKTLFEKIWEGHVVAQEPESPAVLYIDLHLIHEVTSPQAFTGLCQRGLRVRRPDRTAATIDHSLPTRPSPDGTLEGRLSFADELSRKQILQLEENCREYGIPCYGLGSQYNGIVHVIGPELGLTQPGKTIVCGDSHTSTHGAFGALAFGIGTSEVEMVLASQCLLQNRPRTMEVRVEGKLSPGVTAKDIILALIAKIGVGGGTGYVLEYSGPAIRALNMEERMTICNMSIEAGARAGMIAPDEITFDYLAGRDFVPKGADWERAIERWSLLPSDEDAFYDRQVILDASSLEPMITYGTNPGMGISINALVPTPQDVPLADDRRALENALQYMDLRPGSSLIGHPVNVVFIGSCTNSRITDLRMAANLFRGRKVAHGVHVLVVPGSQQVKRQAEVEGLDRVFREAGAEWREAGCSMCIAMNGDQVEPGQYAVSTSNRNFEGRQGKGGRTFLASPLTAAAAALTGQITDPRTVIEQPIP